MIRSAPRSAPLLSFILTLVEHIAPEFLPLAFLVGSEAVATVPSHGDVGEAQRVPLVPLAP